MQVSGLLWDYGYGNNAYWASRFFWGAPTFFDPLAVLLLFKQPRTGIVLTAVFILADVAHSTFYEPFYLSQLAFLIAVLLLSPIPWISVPGRRLS